MKIPLHTKLRRKFRTHLYTLLSTSNKASNTQIDKKEINSIIIVRPNYRIGNILFLTPLINEITKELPNVKIDIIVGMKLAGDILKEMPNINKVIDIPRKSLIHPLDFFKLIKNVRSKKYDLAINISEGSLSSEITTKLINSKYKGSFVNKKTIISLTHTVQKQNLYIHSGSTGLELLKLFTNNLPKNNVALDIKLKNNEIKQAQRDLDNLLIENNISKDTKVISLFRNARFDKKIPDEWWNELYLEINKIEKNTIIIDILSPDIPTKLNKDFLEYSNKNLRLLGAFFSLSNLYLSADTGPLHLALASNSKCLALFNKTEIEKYGTLGDQNLTININNLSPKDVAKIIINII